jgi:hypothetical protein
VSEVINYRLPPQTRWIVCANEGQVCFFSGAQIVGYGSQGVPVVFRQAMERIACNSESFNTTLRNTSISNQCFLSTAPAVSAVSKYMASSVHLMSPSERVNLFVTFRNASSGVDLALFSSPECSPHSLIARTKSGLSVNCSDLSDLANFLCIQLDGVIAIYESGLYEIGVRTSDDVMLFVGSQLVLRTSSTSDAHFYSTTMYFNALDTVVFRASILPSSSACMTTFEWKIAVPGIT